MSSCTAEQPEQLWLDVDRPIHVAPRREGSKSRASGQAASADRQVEMLLAAAPSAPDPPPPHTPDQASQAAPLPSPEPITPPPLPFGGWLLEQGKRDGFLGELAKAAKLDRLFPRHGSADEVRSRFSLGGADGDAFEALDDAECDYERQVA